MLDTWSLRVLAEVAERGSFSAAAEALTMTQPAVSRQIASLERRAGVRLFRRLPRGVVPTAAGVLAIDEARAILGRLAGLEARLGAFAQLRSGHVRLSAFPSANTEFVPAAIRRFSELYPGVEVGLVQAGPGELRTGAVDVALLTSWDEAGDDVDLVPLLDEDHRIALPSTHRLAGRTTVPLRELRGETWIEGSHPDCLGPLDVLEKTLGGPPRIGFTCDDWTGKQALVAAGMGVTIMSTLAASAVRPDVALRPTSPTLPRRRVLAAVLPPAVRTPAATAMLTVLTSLAAGYR
ncbi:LysR family transcriptional regulator [Jiangella alkaliphila]|uniref:DNA-binding transcriptional regulator, LysR family n=1 Tax=Jiangella alkaliphila TaxID=419479 RepID=A0A1H2KXN1_9ACTN|nr:LysR family transcriptional regulator [Jiangella alkaliphila]SDU73470.1 DNA-binding transcriptional regulator, LysR family [Jiangella alkaliphila]